MALFMEGFPCALCKQPIRAPQTWEGFPPFVANECDPLWIFHDAVVHGACFSDHPLAEQARQRLNALGRERPPYTCRVCQGPIRRPTELFPLGHIVDDHPLSGWNYTYFHIACLSHWDGLDQIYEYLSAAYEHGDWKGVAIQHLLTELDAARSQR